MADNRDNNISNEKAVAEDNEVSKATAIDEVEPVTSKTESAPLEKILSPEMSSKVAALYGKKAEDEQIAPSGDVQYIIDKIQNMTEEEAIHILTEAVEYHNNDPSEPISSTGLF